MMKKRITIALGIGLLVFTLGLCGGAPTNQPAPNSHSQSSTLHNHFTLETVRHAYNLPMGSFVALHGGR